MVGEEVVRADDGDERNVDDDLDGESRRVGVGQADEGKVEPAAVRLATKLVRGALGQGDFHAGVSWWKSASRPARSMDPPAATAPTEIMAAQQAGQLIDGGPGARDPCSAPRACGSTARRPRSADAAAATWR